MQTEFERDVTDRLARIEEIIKAHTPCSQLRTLTRVIIAVTIFVVALHATELLEIIGIQI